MKKGDLLKSFLKLDDRASTVSKNIIKGSDDVDEHSHILKMEIYAQTVYQYN